MGTGGSLGLLSRRGNMMPARIIRLSFFSALCFVFSAQPALADLIENIQLDTTPLIGHAAGPFSLDFQLNGSAGNAATLSSITFGVSGGPAGAPIVIGGAAGNLNSTVTLSGINFLNEFTQPFTPGTLLSFQLTLSQRTQALGFPDELTFAILDRTGAELPTQSFSDVFVDIDITAQTTVQTFGSDPTRAPGGGGLPLNIPAPTVQVIVPEPSDLLPLAIGLAMMIRRALCRIRIQREGRPARRPR
jgi:hypothetical protein